MKRVAVFFAGLFLVASVPIIPVVPAQMSASVPVAAPVAAPASVPVAAAPSDLERIGVVAAAGGKVELTTFGQAARTAQSGQPVFMGDEVKTDAGGHLQILLLDETVFTIGPNSTITIDKFVYDPKNHKGEIKASVTKGVFRYVSGKIAAKDPDAVKVKLPTATLGFRGTIVGGSVGVDGQGLVGLLGPGDNNDANVPGGSFSIDGYQGEHENVDRAGFGVGIGEDGDLTDSFRLSEDQVNTLTQGLGGDQGGGGGGGGAGGDDQGGGLGGSDMGDLSGENDALAGENVNFTDGLDNITDNLDDVSTKGAQEALDESGAAMSGALGETTTFSELETVTSPASYYLFSGIFVQVQNTGFSSANMGIITGSLDIDFVNKTIGGGNSFLNLDTTGGGGNISTGDVSIASQSYGGATGPAMFMLPLSDPSVFAMAMLSNCDGVIAQEATVSVSYSNGAPYDNVGSGGAVSDPRVEGTTTGPA